MLEKQSVPAPASPAAENRPAHLTTLAQLRPGQRGRVLRVRGNGAIHRRILDMGISRGAVIEVECEAPLRDPIKIKVRGYALSLRRNEAQTIDVTEMPA